jgi:predicted nuclease of predicted toxin-antitoxin system
LKFLIDAQLPKRMADWLALLGHDAKHTLDLPSANRTTDTVVIATADAEARTVVTKDADFVDRFIIHRTPASLLLISTGNISNQRLRALLEISIHDLVREFETAAFIELGPAGLIVRG